MADRPGPLHDPEPSRGGADIEAAVENAEAGSLTDDVHHPAGPGETSADSRLEHMHEVDTTSTAEGHHAGDVPTGPLPDEIGSGGAQRIVGARISDRVAGGAEPPDGPPFHHDQE